MEREKYANKAVEELINQVKELLHEYAEDQALTDEEVLEEHAYEESFQKDPDEAYHVEDYEEEFNEDEVLRHRAPLLEWFVGPHICIITFFPLILVNALKKSLINQFFVR
jgi:hypothetical protein